MPFVQSNGIQIYYETHGEGTPLLLIGGLSNDVTDYERMIPLLCAHRKLILFDNRGAGRSDKPDIPYSIEIMADDTAGLLEALGIAQTDVIGVSMGGRIALDLALRYQRMVHKLVLVSTSARVLPTPSRKRLDTLLRIPFAQKWMNALNRYPQPYYAFWRQREASGGYDATSRLDQIHSPTLILHGKKDSVAPYALAQEMHEKIQGSQMVTFDGGHIFLFFHPKEFAQAVLDFLG